MVATLQPMLQHQDTDQYVDVIALGEEDDYYVKLSSGKEYWNIPGKLADRSVLMIQKTRLAKSNTFSYHQVARQTRREDRGRGESGVRGRVQREVHRSGAAH